MLQNGTALKQKKRPIYNFPYVWYQTERDLTELKPDGYYWQVLY
jgi:hypothetical protein